MKRYFKTIIAMILLASLASCRKGFLDIVPKGSQVAVTTGDYDLLMNSSSFYFYQGSGGLREFVLMGDEIAAEASLFGQHGSQYGVLTPRAFQWLGPIYDAATPPQDLLIQTGYMYTLNKIINEVMGSAEGSDAQKKSLQREAKATRAFLNFIWVNTYGKPYLASTAGSDPAFPLITEASITTKSFTRASVKEMYDAIIKDLADAIPALPLLNAAQTRMSKPAAEAILAKVYLFMGRYSDAATSIKAAFNDLAAASLPVRLYDYNVEFAPGGSFLPVSSFTGPGGPGNNYNDFTESVLAKTYQGGSYDGNAFENDGLVLTPAAAALYGSTDLRLNFYTNMEPSGIPNPGGRLRKYGLTYVKFGVELSDMYLVSAECKARTNDLSGAVSDVETLRRNRMPSADAKVPGAIAGNQAALIKFILEERIREFAFTGFRWFDMRRLSTDPLYAGAAYTHTLYDPSGNTVYTLKQPERWVLQIPPFYINANPGMVNNP